MLKLDRPGDSVCVIPNKISDAIFGNRRRFREVTCVRPDVRRHALAPMNVKHCGRVVFTAGRSQPTVGPTGVMSGYDGA